MKRLIHGKRRVTAVVLALALGMLSLVAVALADNLQSDLNTTTGGFDKTVNLGTLPANTSQSQSVFLFVDETSGTQNNPTYPLSVSGSGNLGATFTGITITGAGTANGQTGQVQWTTPAAQATTQNYTISVNFSASNVNTSPATVTINFSVAGAPVDSTPPDIQYVLNPTSPDGANGWYTSDVSLTWTVTENESPASLVKTGCNDQNVTADQAATTYSCSATSDGGSAGPVEVTIKRDATDPEVAVTGFTDGQVFVKGVDPLPTAGCSRSDATSDIDASGSTGPTASGGLNANGVGTVTYTCGAKDNAGNTNSDSKSYSVIHNYSGFFRPVDNPDVLNVVKAGSAIPVKFSLSGYQGLNIIATGYPKSNKIDCTSSADLDSIEETTTAGGSTLQYDATADQYVYVWKTEKSWAGTCRQLQVKLDDGTIHVANFKLTK